MIYYLKNKILNDNKIKDAIKYLRQIVFVSIISNVIYHSEFMKYFTKLIVVD